jgi:hypothetical protein
LIILIVRQINELLGDNKMKQNALGTPLRFLDNKKVYYIDDMTQPVRESIRAYTGVHNPFDNEAHVSFKTYHKWMNSLGEDN